jgi:hypothetical protein
MHNIIVELIHCSKGSFVETGGVIIGFFNHPEQACRFTNMITLAAGKKAEVFGSQLSISI